MGRPNSAPPMSVTKIIVPILVLGNSVPRVGSRGGGEEEEEEESESKHEVKNEGKRIET